ncbi:MAG: FHA domain-containing protein [Pyrinomonadaceae bacterium]
MPKAKLIVNNEREVTIEDGIVAVGRASDNTIPLAEDSNVSRYHIEIETRGNEFWLVELGSSNGTTVGGEKIYDERKLEDGDVILLGGTSEIIFEIEKEKPVETSPKIAPQVSASVPTPAVSAASASESEIAADTAKASKMPLMLGIMGVVCGLAVVAVVVAVAVSFSGGGKCAAKAVITSPENGDTIKKETGIEVESENDDCAQKAIFLMDGKEFASASEKPFKTSLDPSQFPDLSDDGTHSLKIALEDEKGEKTIQPGDVQLYFDTLAAPTPTPEPSSAPDDKSTPKTTATVSGKTLSAVEVQGMIQNLLKEFKGLPAYKFDPQFLQEVQKKTSDYSADGYFARAQNYNEAIKVGYIQGAGLDAPLGYILAMSRTQFKIPSAGGTEEGLWRMNPQMVAANGYNGTCEGESLSDAKQNCASKSSALYMKALLINGFENDLIYSVAAFGMSTQDAAIWKSTLPASRADFWNVIKSPKQRDEVVKFFAAGLVAENPQKFGLKKDAPISTLYRNYLVK